MLEYATTEKRETITDWVNPATGEVHKVDDIRYTLQTHCSQQDGYLTHMSSLVDPVFRLFLSNGNQPLTPREIALKIGRDGKETTILRTLSGEQVYNGLMQIVPPCTK